jgi:hypothetical protein
MWAIQGWNGNRGGSSLEVCVMGDSKEMMVWMGRLLFLGGIASGIIGLVAGLADKTWKLGATGWFEGGILMGVLAIVVMADTFVNSRSE